MNQNKTIIAITGQIGSGKSTVCNILREIGEECLDCDEINRKLLQNTEYLIGLKRLFPSVFYNDVFCKNKLKDLIFKNGSEREKLNDYSHTEIKKELLRQIHKSDKQRIFVEVPILNQVKKDFLDIFDVVWFIIADEPMRRERIRIRDKSSEELINDQFSSQTNDHTFPIKTIIINNDGDVELLRQNIISLL